MTARRKHVSQSVLTWSLVLAVLGSLVTAGPAQADDDDRPPLIPCYEMVDFNVVEVACELSAKTIRDAQEAEPNSAWKVHQLCKDGTSGEPEACASPRACTVGGVVGTLYAVFKDGERVGLACLTAGEAGDVEDPPIRVLVIRAFKELDWERSPLVVQPPGGKTLVNLDTNFYTSNSRPSNIPVRLQGQEVVVTARPIAYRWNFGDGTSTTTSSPGAPYPRLDVTHAYQEIEDVVVSVDTQYGDASFTVNGGPPEAIPSTIWVAGAEQDLQVLEARPQLVLR